MAEIIANIIFIILFPFIFLGLVNRVKSFWGGRKGPPLIQPLRDFIRLLKKGEVISATTSFIFRIAPSITFASAVTAATLVPMIGKKSLFSFNADFILFAYLLAIGRFFTVIGAMDTGSSFEGMGASREAVFSSLVEPAFFVIIGTLAFFGKAASFEELVEFSGSGFEIRVVVSALGVIALLIMLITEGCRVPVDDPNTHLELTMIHEVMVLDNSGPDLGLILYSSGLKMVVIGSLIADIALPKLPAAAYVPAFIGVHVIIAALIGTIESLMARLRMSHVPQFIFFMCSISVIMLAVIVLFVSGGLK